MLAKTWFSVWNLIPKCSSVLPNSTCLVYFIFISFSLFLPFVHLSLKNVSFLIHTSVVILENSSSRLILIVSGLSFNRMIEFMKKQIKNVNAKKKQEFFVFTIKKNSMKCMLKSVSLFSVDFSISLWFFGHSCQALTSDFDFSAMFEMVFKNAEFLDKF